MTLVESAEGRRSGGGWAAPELGEGTVGDVSCGVVGCGLEGDEV